MPKLVDEDTLMLYRASCGCIGIPLNMFKANQKMLVLQPCDGEQEIGFFVRGLKTPNTFEFIGVEKSADIQGKVQRLVGLGHRFLEVQSLLGISKEV